MASWNFERRSAMVVRSLMRRRSIFKIFDMAEKKAS